MAEVTQPGPERTNWTLVTIAFGAIAAIIGGFLSTLHVVKRR